jgi:hypothetical protein
MSSTFMWVNPQALDVQWIKCRVNMENIAGPHRITAYEKINRFVYICAEKCIGGLLFIITVTLFFFSHWPYILFTERRVPVVNPYVGHMWLILHTFYVIIHLGQSYVWLVLTQALDVQWIKCSVNVEKKNSVTVI